MGTLVAILLAKGFGIQTENNGPRASDSNSSLTKRRAQGMSIARDTYDMLSSIDLTKFFQLATFVKGPSPLSFMIYVKDCLYSLAPSNLETCCP